jgi:hypothetical protein
MRYYRCPAGKITGVAIFKRFTKDQIARKALKELRLRGCRVRKVHNVAAYKKRKNQVEPGWPDIQGFQNNTGVMVLCEVKTEGDYFSQAQIDLMLEAQKAGCICLVATAPHGIFKIEAFGPEHILKPKR